MYEIYQGQDEKWYWRLKSANHDIIAQGQGYIAKDGCLKGIEAVGSHAQASIVLDLSSTDHHGNPVMVNLDVRRK